MTTTTTSASGQPRFVDASIHGHMPYSEEQLGRINKTLSAAGKKALGTRVQKFRWVTQTVDGLRELELELNIGKGRNEGDIIVVDLMASITTSASKVLQSGKRLKDIQTVFGAVAAEKLKADFACSVCWNASVEGTELPIRLPFGLPLATTSELQQVSGIRVSNDDGSVWVILDLTPTASTAGVHITCGFGHETALSENALEEIIERGKSLVSQLVVFSVKGE